NAMDSLKKGDVVILTTPPAFRWVHFKYAIEKGLNVFMEKPVTVDGPSTRKMLELYEESKKKNLKVGVGLMCRHCADRVELARRSHRIRQLRSLQQGLGNDLGIRPLAIQGPHLQGPEDDRQRSDLEGGRQDHPLPTGMGPPDERYPPGSSLQRSEARCRGQPG